jgi:hypothetical protein
MEMLIRLSFMPKRKSKNFIAKIMSSDGQTLTSHEDKAAAFFDFYSGLLGSAHIRDTTVDLDALGVTSHELVALDAPFSEDEVWETIKRLPSDKAPGPDGFIGRFYKTCWPIIKTDIMAVVSCVWARRFGNLRPLNSAFITLLPKIDEASGVKDYRPISLIHSFGKLVPKILASRLAGRIQHMVSPNQFAFIKNCFIQDNFILVQQTARFLHQQKQPRFLFKLDISKAFNSVFWAFLIEVMRKMGFGHIWWDMISRLLTTSSTQILLNGVPGDFIAHQRGLRQGDPLSPMLFILILDVLALLVQRASEEGHLQPLSVKQLKHRISMYADHAVIFLRPDPADILLVLDILSLFGKASGLQTNIQKSNVVPIRCDERSLVAAKELLPCEFVDFPCKYLELPLSIKKLPKSSFQSIVDRMASMLPGWKAELMNHAGCAIHVQFVMTAKIIYTAMAIEFPPWAFKAMTRLQRGFLWKGRKDVKGGHCLLAWPKVTHPKELGGLGIHDVRMMGWALRACWSWLQRTESDKPWVQFQIQTCKEVQSLIDMAMVTVIGDGTNTYFWKDKWLDGKRIKEIAPTLYAMVPKRIINTHKVSEALLNQRWISDFRGALSLVVLLDFFQLYRLLEDVVLQPGAPDSHLWRLSSSGKYSTKSAYNALLQGAISFEPAERIWKTWAPGKCRFFMWLVEHNRCWTSDRLTKRGLDHPERCPLCDQHEETINHLLVACVFACQVWSGLLVAVELRELVP